MLCSPFQPDNSFFNKLGKGPKCTSEVGSTCAIFTGCPASTFLSRRREGLKGLTAFICVAAFCIQMIRHKLHFLCHSNALQSIYFERDRECKVRKLTGVNFNIKTQLKHHLYQENHITIGRNATGQVGFNVLYAQMRMVDLISCTQKPTQKTNKIHHRFYFSNLFDGVLGFERFCTSSLFRAGTSPTCYSGLSTWPEGGNGL